MARIRAIGLSALASVGLYAVVVASADWEATWQAVLTLAGPVWIWILCLSLLNYALRFARWHGYLHRLDHPLQLRFHGLIYIAGFAFTTTPGKVGEAIRSLYLKPLGVPYTDSLAALFAERLLDLAAMLLLAALMLVALENQLLTYCLLVGAVVMLMVLVRSKATRSWIRRWAGTQDDDRRSGRRIRQAGVKIAGLLESSSRLLSPGLLMGGLLLGGVSWGAEGVGLYYIAQGLGIELPVSTAIGIYAVSMLAGALSFIPGGLGSAEAVMGLLLVLNGADTPSAVAATLICRVATLWFAVLLGGLAFAALEVSGTRRRLEAT